MSSQSSRPPEKGPKLVSVLTGIYVSSLILANVTSQKFFALGPLVLPGGVLVFPISFIFGDILTEVYGYAVSRKVIWIGLFCQAWAALTYLVVGILPSASFYQDQAAYDKILGFVPRIVAGSILACFCAEFCNTLLLSKMKYWDKGARGLKQAWRFIVSTTVGQAVDTLVFLTVAFGGVLSPAAALRTYLSLYVLKVAYEVVSSPVSTRFANWVKKLEGIDHIDYPEHTRYSPFAMFAANDKPKKKRK